jgi:hypothetical protein
MNQRAIYATAVGRQMAAVNEAAIIRLTAANPTINLTIRPLSEIINATLRQHSGRRFGAQQNPKTLIRWVVNYIRHELSDYDAQLELLPSTIAANQARASIRHRLYQNIAKTYPPLAGECARQLSEREPVTLN